MIDAKTIAEYKCDVCGKPATSLATDFLRRQRNGHYEFSPVGPVKHGCDDHPVESEKFTTGLGWP